jgi:hypothetical protein
VILVVQTIAGGMQNLTKKFIPPQKPNYDFPLKFIQN